MTSYGRVPTRSTRSKLSDKGYKEYDTHDGRVTFGHAKAEADNVVKHLHKQGFLARIVTLNNGSIIVMYKEKK
jgi:hypothetical protein